MAAPLSADGCLLDLDGTVYADDEVIPGAAEAIAGLRAARVPLRFATNTTRQPRAAQLSLDAGPFVAALEYAAAKKARLVGKPSPGYFESAVAELGLPANRVAMVGDDLEADVEGAIAAGLMGVALRTGKYTPEAEARAHQASTAVLDSLAELPDWLGLAGL